MACMQIFSTIFHFSLFFYLLIHSYCKTILYLFPLIPPVVHNQFFVFKFYLFFAVVVVVLLLLPLAHATYFKLNREQKFDNHFVLSKQKRFVFNVQWILHISFCISFEREWFKFGHVLYLYFCLCFCAHSIEVKVSPFLIFISFFFFFFVCENLLLVEKFFVCKMHE